MMSITYPICAAANSIPKSKNQKLLSLLTNVATKEMTKKEYCQK